MRKILRRLQYSFSHQPFSLVPFLRNRDNHKARLRDEFAGERAAALIESQLLSLPPSMIVGFSSELILDGSFQNVRPLLWFAALVAANVARYAFALVFKTRITNPVKAKKYLYSSVFVNLIAGLVWAALPLFLIDLNNYREITITILLSGIAAGAAVHLGAYLAMAAIAIFIPIEICVAFLFIRSGGIANYIIAFNCLLFALMLLKNCAKAENEFCETLRLKTEALELAASLEREHAAAQAAADRLFELANHDYLTGLANRGSFAESLNQWIETAKQRREGFFFITLDLDRFKSINDSMGHGAGDKVLCEVAARLSKAVPQDHVAARLGGDEFAVLVLDQGDHSGTASRCRTIAENILANVNGPFQLEHAIINISVSLGVSYFPDDGLDGDRLSARADLALYAAKDGGRNGWRRYDPAMAPAKAVAS